MKGFVNRAYSLNYELLKKTCIRYESKLLDSESEVLDLHSQNEKLQNKIKEMNKRMEIANKRIKELVLVEGGKNEPQAFSTNTSGIQPNLNAGNQSPWLDLSGIQKIQGTKDHSPARVFYFTFYPLKGFY